MNDTTHHSTGTGTGTGTAVDVVRRHYAASDRGDLAGMVADLSPSVEWTEAAGFPLAGTYVGPDAVVAGVFAKLAEEWDGYALAVEEVLDAGDVVVGLGTYSGTHRATGRSFSARVAHVWRVREGSVVRFEQITDTALVRAAMP